MNYEKNDHKQLDSSTKETQNSNNKVKLDNRSHPEVFFRKKEHTETSNIVTISMDRYSRNRTFSVGSAFHLRYPIYSIRERYSAQTVKFHE